MKKGVPRQKRVWRWLLVGVYIACVFVGSSIPGSALPDFRTSDKLLHMLEFGVLAVLFCRAMAAQMPTRSPFFIVTLSILLTVGYGISDEAHQLLVPYRVSSLGDLAADSLGSMLGSWFWYWAGARWRWLQ